MSGGFATRPTSFTGTFLSPWGSAYASSKGEGEGSPSPYPSGLSLRVEDPSHQGRGVDRLATGNFLLDPFKRIEKLFVFLQGISVGHSREVIADDLHLIIFSYFLSEMRR